MTAVLSLTASACVTVHGERAVVPSATNDEAAQALAAFTEAYNKADKAYDPALDAAHVTGPLGAINQAGLKARQVNFPNGNPNHTPLELTDTKFLIPKKAGWPRWFVADTDSNLDEDGGAKDSRWVLVFVRTGPDAGWEAAYLTILSPQQIPAFRTDKDGHAEPVAPDSTALAVAPRNLSEEYASYLKEGKPDHFKAGPHTSAWREARAKTANVPGTSTQYIDQPLDSGDFAPLGLVTQDGGGFVFFSARNFERQTAAKGVRLKVVPDVKALMTGEVKSSLTKERVSNLVAVVPPGNGREPGQVVDVRGRLTGLTSAKGS
ncbi:hypothetical protein [Streptomyces peucetius]|uniref:DUF8094 domain-containing protein n=1 Tax=Streptomyces peucetius TaxID=1950 RepID=A0ABY6I744_STRPE|nr:hypothetical protein [Streptomyces peucetius]UYQ61792.1 hypothetical protein OGH68_09995 [Streptomyces peucetius]